MSETCNSRSRDRRRAARCGNASPSSAARSCPAASPKARAPGSASFPPTRKRWLREPRSCACGPPAWNAIMNACPVVCITAFAKRKLSRLIRCRISAHTPTHASGPALRHSRSAAADRGEQRVEIGLRIRDAQRKAVRRLFAPDRSDGARLVECRTACRAARRTPPCRHRPRLRHRPSGSGFGIRAPVTAIGDRGRARARSLRHGVRTTDAARSVPPLLSLSSKLLTAPATAAQPV